VGAILLAGVAVAPAANAAGGCVAIIAADGPANRDMARGADFGNLANLDSTGLRAQERWEEIPVAGGFVVLRSNLRNLDGAAAAASVSSTTSGSAVRSTVMNIADTHQQWVRTAIGGGKVTYRNRFSNLQITRNPNQAEFPTKPIIQTAGVTGGNQWTELPVACL
jgi:hypothetical protein